MREKAKEQGVGTEKKYHCNTDPLYSVPNIFVAWFIPRCRQLVNMKNQSGMREILK